MSSFSPPTIVVKDETNLEAVRFTLNWTIHHFEGLKNKDGKMYSPGITMAELGMDEGYRGRFRIRVTPCHSITENNGEKHSVSVFLSLTDEDLKSTLYMGERVSCVFRHRVATGKLADVSVYIATTFTNPKPFSCGCSSWGFDKVISHEDLFGSGAKAIKDYCLHFATDVIIYGEPMTTRLTEAVFPRTHQRYREFLGRQLKQQEAGGDFLIVSNDRQEFRVDRCLLMAQSPVFAAMLKNIPREQTSGWKMKHVDGECVEILLDYVYGCDTSKIQGSNAEKVLVMADKYQMMDLRAVCEMILAKGITVDNAVHVFALARQHNLRTLKDAAVKFIRKNMDVKAVLDESIGI